MKRISVVMPTITGREEMWARLTPLYAERAPGFDIEVCSPKDYPNWPSGINAAKPTGAYLIYTADDLEPLAGWADAMVDALNRGIVPAPQVWNWTREGPPVNLAQDGPVGASTAFSRIPALTREMAESIGPWPADLDYYGDNWVSDVARLRGWEVVVTDGFCFIHHWNQHGRLDAGDWVGRNVPKYNRERAKLGLPPVER